MRVAGSNGVRVKVHCHLCGATLRSPHEFGRLWRADIGDEIVVCTDVRRCDARIAHDPFGGAGARTERTRVESIREVRGTR